MKQGAQEKLSTEERVWSFAEISWSGEEEIFRPPLSAREKSDTNKDRTLRVTARRAEVLGVKTKFYCHMIGKRKKAEKVKMKWRNREKGAVWGVISITVPRWDDSAMDSCFAYFSSPRGT